LLGSVRKQEGGNCAAALAMWFANCEQKEWYRTL